MNISTTHAQVMPSKVAQLKRASNVGDDGGIDSDLQAHLDLTSKKMYQLELWTDHQVPFMHIATNGSLAICLTIKCNICHKFLSIFEQGQSLMYHIVV